MAKYYLTQRGPSPGTVPIPWDNSVMDIKDYGKKTYVEEIGMKAWGHVDYKYPLNHQDIKNYELMRAKKENEVPFDKKQSGFRKMK